MLVLGRKPNEMVVFFLQWFQPCHYKNNNANLQNSMEKTGNVQLSTFSIKNTPQKILAEKSRRSISSTTFINGGGWQFNCEPWLVKMTIIRTNDHLKRIWYFIQNRYLVHNESCNKCFLEISPKILLWWTTLNFLECQSNATN